MSTRIEWASSSINFLTGCQMVDACCSFCYSQRLTATRLSQNPKYAGLTDERKRFTGEVRYWPEVLDGLLRKKKGDTFFVNSMSDTFHKDVKDEWLDRAFATFALTPQHRYLLLTKRADRMREYMTTDPWGVSDSREWSEMANYVYDQQIRPLDGALFLSGEAGPNLPNVALGVSCGLQESVHRIADLCATPAAYRFVSVEPMLGEVLVDDSTFGCRWTCEECGGDVEDEIPTPDDFAHYECVNPACQFFSSPGDDPDWTPLISQVIIGCESHGPRLGRLSVDGQATPDTWLSWAIDLADQCRAAGVRVFTKQIPSPDGRLLHSRTVIEDPTHPDMALWPQALRSWEPLPWEED